MSLRKDDPIYYKNKIAELVEQARENGLMVYMPRGEKYICFKCLKTGEITSSFMPRLFKDNR